MTEPNDVLDAPQKLELGDGQRGRVVHGRRNIRIEAKQLPTGFQPGEQVVHTLGLCRRFNASRQAVDSVGHKLERLDLGPVPHPGIAGLNPTNLVRVYTVPEQPSARIRNQFCRRR